MSVILYETVALLLAKILTSHNIIAPPVKNC